MKQLSLFEKILFVLSLYVIIELYIGSIITYSENLAFWLNVVDTLICVVFLVDFFRGLYLAEKKWRYVRKNWIHFVSSIPFVGFLRIGRVVKVFRLLRLVRSAGFLYRLINQRNSSTTFKNLLILNMLVVVFIAMSFYLLEHKTNPAITSFADTFWWSLIRMVSFSHYNDIKPVTFEGQIISAILILLRLILFSTLIGVITDFFLGKPEEDRDKHLEQRIDQLDERLTNIEQLLQRIYDQKNKPTQHDT